MQHTENFINLSYSTVSFLIPKADVFTALSCVQNNFFTDNQGQKKIKIASQNLSYIDFDQFAKVLNQSYKKVHTRNCIILKSSSIFPGENQIALVTSGECRVKQISLKDFALFSDFYTEKLKESGIIACKFDDDGKINYLIETETFLKKYLELKI